MSTLQVPLFPISSPAAPMDVHAVSIPARTFTGDFWFTHRAGNRLWFALGDVAGKGLPAALVMAMIQEELEHRITACARRGCDPAATMQRLDAFLRPLLAANRFATAVIGWLADDGTLKIANAGHCPPLIVRANGVIDMVGSTGPVVGILPSARWSARPLRLGAGETLLLYSDGVVESASPDGVEFGVGGLERALATSADCACCPHAIADAIVQSVNRHTGGTREDDLTLLVIRGGGVAESRGYGGR